MKTQRNVLLLALMVSCTAHIILGLESDKLVQAYEYQIRQQEAQLQDRQEEIEILNIILENREEPKKPVNEPEYIGTFEITYYTAGVESTGKYPGDPEYGITASGTNVKEGQTVAADWSVLEPGSRIYIDGIGIRTVEDTGGLIQGQAIDVYVEDVETARQGGRHTADVWRVNDGNGN